MVNTLSAAGVRDANAENIAVAWLILMKISHTDMSTIYLVGNTEDIISNGITYSAAYIDVALPSEKDEDVPTMKVALSNVDTTVLAALRTIGHQTSARAEVTFSAIRHVTPNTIERGPYTFDLEQMNADNETISMQLVWPDFLTDAVVSYKYLPSWFPGGT